MEQTYLPSELFLTIKNANCEASIKTVICDEDSLHNEGSKFRLEINYTIYSEKENQSTFIVELDIVRLVKSCDGVVVYSDMEDIYFQILKELSCMFSQGKLVTYAELQKEVDRLNNEH